jgi:hypothetical protein
MHGPVVMQHYLDAITSPGSVSTLDMVKCNLEVNHVDVTTAFLIPELEEEVYMLPPVGYRDNLCDGEVWKLNKSIYGRKQASRAYLNTSREQNCTTTFGTTHEAHPCRFYWKFLGKTL